tara:strand:- start:289 stop:1254 length:966 start_codon:yes stop_codon:yes gene_type:complete
MRLCGWIILGLGLACTPNEAKKGAPAVAKPAAPKGRPPVKAQCATAGEGAEGCWRIDTADLVVKAGKKIDLKLSIVLEMSKELRSANSIEGIDEKIGEDLRRAVVQTLGKKEGLTAALEPAALSVLPYRECEPIEGLCDGCDAEPWECSLGGVSDRFKDSPNPNSNRNSADAKRRAAMNAEIRGRWQIPMEHNDTSQDYTWAKKGQRPAIAGQLLQAVNAEFGPRLKQDQPFIAAYITHVAWLGREGDLCISNHTSAEVEPYCPEEAGLTEEECYERNRKGYLEESRKNTSGPGVFCAPGYTCEIPDNDQFRLPASCRKAN